VFFTGKLFHASLIVEHLQTLVKNLPRTNTPAYYAGGSVTKEKSLELFDYRNAVFVAGGWRLIQCNWAMLNLHSKVERETRKFYQVL
jgi:hypothetical protein